MAAGNVQISTVVPYLGQLFQTTRRPNALLKLLGGLQGGVMETTAKEFPIGAFWSLPSPAQPAILEGANAPTPNYRALTQTTNVIQIFQEAVQVTYLAASDKAVSGVVPIPLGEAQGTIYIQPESTVFGVKVRKILTRFGTLMLVLEPDMPANKFAIVNAGVCGIVGLPVPQKGILFEEPLFKQGSADQTQIYGQLGIDHGPEYYHGVCTVVAGIAL